MEWLGNKARQHPEQFYWPSLLKQYFPRHIAAKLDLSQDHLIGHLFTSNLIGYLHQPSALKALLLSSSPVFVASFPDFCNLIPKLLPAFAVSQVKLGERTTYLKPTTNYSCMQNHLFKANYKLLVHAASYRTEANLIQITSSTNQEPTSGNHQKCYAVY